MWCAMLDDARPEDIAARLTRIEQRVDDIAELVDALRAGLADLLATTATVDETGGVIGPTGEHADDAHDQDAPVATDTRSQRSARRLHL